MRFSLASERGRLPATFSTLTVDLPSLRSAFLHDPWVAGVGRIRIHGHRLVVPLSYREPMALARFETNEPEIAVDAEGVLLDAKEIDDSAADLAYLDIFPRRSNPISDASGWETVPTS